ncbi:MAG: hypothetical protein B6242_02765 [Anaerolineaceae bacterium 4572_78]|nr:MAG: hypothetical protein B6242_02765 [Anaerolineaceae bacterium 4572_78]
MNVEKQDATKKLADFSYSLFTLEDVKYYFQIVIDTNTTLFPNIESVSISEHLKISLDKFVPLAKAIDTEKARSEWIVAPVLSELWDITKHRISLFSGIDFNVDAKHGLKGRCDFIVSLSLDQLLLQTPVITIVEAKKDNIKGGYGQCISTMVAAQRFNNKASCDIKSIYGIVTTGTNWQFLKLEGKLAYIDTVEYHITTPDKILGVLSHVIKVK